MKVRFEREWPVPPQTAWPYLTLAERMNLWSEASIVPERGEGQEGRAGSHRCVVVRALGLTLRLHETVMSAAEPHDFCYQVTPGWLLRGHRGTIRLHPSQHGTQMTWDVEFESTIPGGAALLARFLRPMMERSLSALDAILQELRVQESPLEGPLAPGSDHLDT